ncbi:MAG: hypothetical protein P4L70_08720 [Parasulfuritortus sp.]|nr:hypothetical protein [Parasulfuritortus sp.]
MVTISSIQGVDGLGLAPQAANAGQLQPQPQVPTVGSGVVDKVSISSTAGIQLGRDQSISGGKLINQADQTLAKQQDTLSHMNEKLAAIIKQYPPYGEQDPQRVAYLKEFSGLRKELESLQVPRDPQAESTLPKTVNFPSQGKGLSIPSLDWAASDKQVANAAQHVQASISQVAGQRADLAQSVQSALGGSAYSNLVQTLS